MYEPGSDGVVWWTHYQDKSRRLPAAGLLDRCAATHTCPKIIEAFGSSEFWGLRMSPDLIGTDARHDLPLPDNVRRYYYPGTTHGGGRGGFHVDTTPNNACVLPANPNPESDQTRALTRALVEWVTKGTPPPPSRYPRLANGDLVPATRAAIGYPDVPGLPFSDRVLNPVVRYDFGPGFKAVDVSGTMSIVPPRVLGVVPTYVPRVNEDGNETAGVASVLLQAPLGTYLGWNVYRSGFFAGQGCGFQGGWIPFAKTKAERLANNDPRPSLEERYGTLDRYVAIVKGAADEAVRNRFLLSDDAERLVHEAETSDILPHAAASAPASTTASCVQLASITLPNAAVTAARVYPAGEFTSGRTFQVPAFCRVMATATPTPDSDIKVEVWLPEAWNGKLLGVDNGGFSGAINYAALAGAVTKGYAAVSTDTGHTGDQMEFGIGHPEKIVDWAYRSVHEMTSDRQERRRTCDRTGAGTVVLHRLLDRRTAGAQRSAALSCRLRRHCRRRSRQQSDQPDLRLPLVVAGDPRCGRRFHPGAREAAGAGAGRGRGLRQERWAGGRPDRRSANVPLRSVRAGLQGRRNERVPDAETDRCGEEGVRWRDDEERTAAVSRLGARQRSRMGHVHHGSQGAGPHRVVPQLGVPGSVVGPAFVRLGQGCRHREREVSVPQRDGDRLSRIPVARREADHVHGSCRPGRVTSQTRSRITRAW